MDALEIMTTGDGSHTLRHPGLNETYHSRHGALQESLHVFIGNGLAHFCEIHHPAKVSVLEVGFGTGLNALLAWQYATRSGVSIRYTALEPFPLEEALWSKLNYGGSEPHAFRSLHEAPWDREAALSPGFTLLKWNTALQEVNFTEAYDVVFFDAFAPSVQPELWTAEMLGKIARTLRKGGVFVTYSAKGQLKRDLAALGLVVETLPGPPGKNQMVRARVV